VSALLLQQLLDDGLISDDEFHERRAKVMDQL